MYRESDTNWLFGATEEPPTGATRPAASGLTHSGEHAMWQRRHTSSAQRIGKEQHFGRQKPKGSTLLNGN